MGEGKALCTREGYSLQDAVMDEFIVQDEILRTEQMANGCDIGCVSTHQNDSVVDPVGLGDFLFELPMNRPFPRH